MSFLTAAKVKSEMYMRGITQKQLAEMLGVSAPISVTSSTVKKGKESTGARQTYL